jgi:hypothetical protein
VIVRRVVEARRLHYQRQKPHQNHHNSNQIDISTSRTPALTVAEKETSEAMPVDRSRQSRFWLGLSKRVSKKKLNSDTETEGEEHPVKEKEMRGDPGDKKDSWWKRLRCL